MQTEPDLRDDAPRPPSPAAARRAQLLVLVVVGAIALALRAWYVEAHAPVLFAGSDNTWYHGVGRAFAEGDWGRVPGPFGELVFSARFPPGYPLVLATGQRLFFWMPALRAHLWTSVALGTAGAVLTTALAWRLASAAPLRSRVLVAAVTGLFVAANPLVVGAAAAVMSEVLILPLVAAFLLLLDIVTTRPSPARTAWIALTLVVVATTFTRSEGLAFLGVPLLVLAIVHRRSRPVRNRLLAVAGVAVVVAIVWSGLLSASAGRPIVMGTNSGSLVLGANCDTTLHGDGRGSWDRDCAPVPAREVSPDLRAALAVAPESVFELAPQLGVEHEGELSAAQLRIALRRIGDDPGATIAAVPFRWARGLGVIAGGFEQRLTDFEGRNADQEDLGHAVQRFLVLPLVLVVLIALAWRRSRLGVALRALVAPSRLVPAAAVIATWLVMIALSYGSARFRQPVEPVFALATGLAVGALVGCLPARDRAGTR